MSSYEPIQFGALMKGKTVLLAADAGERMNAIARLLCEQGANVYCVEKNGNPADGLVQTATLLNADLADEDSAAQAVQQILSREATLDSVIFCLCPVCYAKAEDASGEYLSELYRRNLLSMANVVSKAIVPMKKQRGGTLVAVTSDYGASACPEVAAYAAIAAGMTAYVRNAAMEYCKYEIRGNSVMPGFNVGVNQAVYAAHHPDRDVEDDFIRFPVLPCKGTEEDVANAVLFCASSLSNAISGECFPVDGGVLAIGHSNVWNPKDRQIYSTWNENDKKSMTATVRKEAKR